ncbi:MAG: hypothetical protein JWR24_3013 [Actinoallomurus sp.]|nr:hypothetical protein [Actinoallomurus sp.]
MREGHERRIRAGHEMRWGGLAGIGAVIFAIIARLVLGGTPRSTETMGVIATYMNDHRGRILFAALLYGIAIALFLWFGAALSTAFRRADETSDAPAVVLAGFTLISAIGFVAVSMFGAMTYALTVHAGLLILAAVPYTTATIMVTIAGIAMAVPLTASAIAIARTHIFPMWMAYFAGLVALLSVVAAFMVWGTRGAWAPGNWLQTYVPTVLLGLWVLAASALLVREHLPVMAARTPPHAMGPA